MFNEDKQYLPQLKEAGYIYFNAVVRLTVHSTSQDSITGWLDWKPVGTYVWEVGLTAQHITLFGLWILISY